MIEYEVEYEVEYTVEYDPNPLPPTRRRPVPPFAASDRCDGDSATMVRVGAGADGAETERRETERRCVHVVRVS